MPHEKATPDSRPLFQSMLERLSGKSRNKDIDLPMSPGGRRDPRLPAAPGEVGRSIVKGYKIVRSLGGKR